MGRQRKPATLRQLEGNPGKRLIPKEIAPIGLPKPPANLTAEQLERWEAVVRSLPMEFLSETDEQVLERMAVAWARFRAACQEINQTGLLVRGKNSSERILNPMLRVQKTAAEEMHICGLLLGLSPLARARLAAPEKVDEDPLTVLLGPHGKPWGDERIPVAAN